MDKIQQQYKTMLTIRLFEEKILELFGQNKISGTTHTYIGQEATAVAVMDQVKDRDVVFSNHRCHGHYIAYGGPLERLLSEIMSKENGICRGCGGSQHIHYKNLFSNGVQGGIVPNAAGAAWAEKIKKEDGIAVVFIGDGTLGQGVVYETFNMAALFEIPVLFIIEDNSYAMTTKTREGVSGSIAGRPFAFGIQTAELTSTDVEDLDAAFAKAFSYVRTQGKPFCQVVHNYRLGAHSKGDDFRDLEEIEDHRKKDPLLLAAAKLTDEFCQSCREEITLELERLLQKVEEEDCILIEEMKERIPEAATKNFPVTNRHDIKCVEAINQALGDRLEADSQTLILGEDICDPYGGAYKATRGLSSRYAEQVINTPISEAGFTGLGVGLALGGVHPVIEMMFGDFITLGFDQILNHATKYPWVYGVKMPLAVRTPMGGYRGYGPTHAQTLDKYFIGIPGLTVMAVSPVHNVTDLYRYALEQCQEPLLMIENKKMYAEKLLITEDGKLQEFFVQEFWNHRFPSVRLSLDPGEKADMILVTYGGMTKMALEAAKQLLIEEEIMVDVLVVSQLNPTPVEDLRAGFQGCRSVVTLEEGTLKAGWGADLITVLREEGIVAKAGRVAALDLPLPNGIRLETQVLPSVEKVKNRCKEIYHE